MSTTMEQESPAESQLTERQKKIKAARAYLDLCEQHHELSVPGFFSTYVASKDLMVSLVKRIGGEWNKEVSDYLEQFSMEQKFHDAVWISLKMNRDDVCQLVTVGTQKVKKQVPADPDYTPPEVEMREIEVDEEIKEWRCPESLLALAKQDEASDE